MKRGIRSTKSRERQPYSLPPQIEKARQSAHVWLLRAGYSEDQIAASILPENLPEPDHIVPRRVDGTRDPQPPRLRGSKRKHADLALQILVAASKCDSAWKQRGYTKAASYLVQIGALSALLYFEGSAAEERQRGALKANRVRSAKVDAFMGEAIRMEAHLSAKTGRAPDRKELFVETLGNLSKPKHIGRSVFYARWGGIKSAALA